MGYVATGLAAIFLLTVALGWALYATTRLGARLFSVERFHWFDGAPAGGSLARRAGARAFGVLGPYAVCVALYFVGRLAVGTSVPTTSVKVLDGPAQEAGIRKGDRVVSIDGTPIESWEGLRAAVRERGGPRRVEIERDGSRRVVTVTPNSRGAIGVAPIERREPVSVLGALGDAVKGPFIIVGLTARSVAPSSEPVELGGAVAAVRDAPKERDGSFVMFAALLAAAYWPFFAGISVFDAATLALFRRRSGATTEPPERARLARRRQTLAIALVCLVISAIAKAFGEANGVETVLALLLLITVPGTLAHFPLVWLLSRDLEGTRKAHLTLALCLIVPCSGLVVGGLLIAKASRALASPAPATS